MRRLVTAAFLLAGPAWAGYQYYLTDNLTAINASKWIVAGTVTPTPSGLASSDSNGGSLVSRVPISDGSNEAEVSITIALKSSGGVYTEFLQASANARTSRAATGSYLAFEMQNPKLDVSGACSANFLLFQSTGGVTSLLASFQHGCRDGMTMRLATHDSTVMLWPDQPTPMEFPIAKLVGGQPGIGAYATPAGNAISQVQIGAIGRIAPAAVGVGRIGVAAFPRRVDLQWPAAIADVNNRGLAGYWVYRDDIYLGRTAETMFTDETVAPASVHTYSVYVVDQHLNFSAAASTTVSVPSSPALSPPSPLPDPAHPPRPIIPTLPVKALATADGAAVDAKPRDAALSGEGPATAGAASATEPRQLGVRANGSYWGAAGEQINMLSGNLNFTVPLFKPQARGGWSLTFALSYNSQIWRQDSGGTWMFGKDVGYGLSWKLQAGAITPIYGPNLLYFLYTDSTGAEYRLDQNTNGVWTSQEGVYVSYDSNTGRLYFPDGSFWVMGCISGGFEQDGGTAYPTTIYDPNGNTITVQYDAGAGIGTINTSARITQITDARTGGYYFTYGTDPITPIKHLTSVHTTSGVGENYTFQYVSGSTLPCPFPNAPTFLYWTLPISMGATGLGASYSFQYSYGEMIGMTTPLGGTLQWSHRTFTFTGGISVREVNSRTAALTPGASPLIWYIFRDDTTDATLSTHSLGALYDVGAAMWKEWAFNYAGPSSTLVNTYYELHDWTSVSLTKFYFWSQSADGNTYLSGVTSATNLNQSSSMWTNTTQTRDIYGNILQSQVYDYIPFGQGFGSPARTYNYSYLHTTNANYLNRYIRNRVTSVTVTTGGTPQTLATNYYDTYPFNDACNFGGLTTRSGLPNHDDSYNAQFIYRGNLVETFDLGSAASTKMLVL